MLEVRATRRALLVACVGAGGAALTVSAGLSYATNLATAGVLPDAMRRIRHANPGKVTNLIELQMPNRVLVQVFAPNGRTFRVATWTAGRLHSPDPHYPPAPLAMEEEIFDLNRDLPLVGDLIAAAGRAHPEGGALVPDVTRVKLTGMGKQLLAKVSFEATRKHPALQIDLGVGDHIYPRSVQPSS